MSHLLLQTLKHHHKLGIVWLNAAGDLPPTIRQQQRPSSTPGRPIASPLHPSSLHPHQSDTTVTSGVLEVSTNLRLRLRVPTLPILYLRVPAAPVKLGHSRRRLIRGCPEGAQTCWVLLASREAVQTPDHYPQSAHTLLLLPRTHRHSRACGSAAGRHLASAEPAPGTFASSGASTKKQPRVSQRPSRSRNYPWGAAGSF